MTHVQTKKGFTLIELLVVIAIIAILSAIGLVALNGAREKARDAQRRSDIAQIRTALSLYYDDNGSTYPVTVTGDTVTSVDRSENSAGEQATGYGADNVFSGDATTCVAAGDDVAAGGYGVLSQCGALTTNYLAQTLKGPTAGSNSGTDDTHDYYGYVDNNAIVGGSATDYVVSTQLEAAGGTNFYAINASGTVTDILDAETSSADCSVSPCGY
ncbi:MAG: hypothetical protein COT25_04205 [Candidatus Kerfeldbacteria bacterium CG08_land_8_20_14_0_20_42_7]|uniref:Type II secretion system protein GspG C-terminal domain-containing protein n=1 Tax=Candidatus Kerfeldbacteria bacterium CG08_land_8_20_14_0_20_42_7 TaxID=2014245 RepID=A0A2H0YU08_9BACT|nr:MAG: hypothetical protein COT25_04205 [Candidatus Kerfeldbacteria bacterium CG08_land_8_20_14_0_20_42_7]